MINGASHPTTWLKQIIICSLWRPSKHTVGPPANTEPKKWLQFFVQWEGYDESSNTWEPWENVAKVDVLQEYLAATPGLKQFVNKNLTTDPEEVT